METKEAKKDEKYCWPTNVKQALPTSFRAPVSFFFHQSGKMSLSRTFCPGRRKKDYSEISKFIKLMMSSVTHIRVHSVSSKVQKKPTVEEVME